MNTKLPKVDWDYLHTGASKHRHGPRMAGSGFGKPNKCIGTISSDCNRNRHFACTKLDCPCECHNEE